MIKELNRLVEDVLKKSVSIQESSRWDELGFDSLSIIQLIVLVEEEFQTSVPEFYWDCQNLKDVGHFVMMLEQGGRNDTAN